MSTTEFETPESYADVARLRGDRVLLYQEFGSYQGEWAMFSLSVEGGFYRIWRGWYGSCSGCDDLQARGFGSKEDVDAFLDEYRPFAEIPRDTARRLAANGSFMQVFPANFREEFATDQLVNEIEVQIKIEEDLPVSFADAARSMSQETRRRVLERIEIEEHINRIVDEDGADRLIIIDGDTYLHLQDSSTPRRYLLRVPDTMERVRQAKAWTFNIDEDEYDPVIET